MSRVRNTLSYKLTLAGLAGLMLALPWWLYSDTSELGLLWSVSGGVVVPLLLLFAVVNLARKEKLDAELLLTHANAKFVRRFQQVENRLRDQGSTLAEATLEEMDAQWNAVKDSGH